MVKGLAGGKARIRAVYSDPAFKRGYAAEIELPVRSILPESTLDAVHAEFSKLTIVVGDSVPLHAVRSYSRRADRFEKSCGPEASWSSSATGIVNVDGGRVNALHPGSATITLTSGGKSDTIALTVVQTPVIQRISFGLKETPPRAGWLADNGKPFTAERGYGWIDPHDLSLRDDRNSAHHLLLKSFVTGKSQKFKLKVPPGQYSVRIAMGDHDYGASPFECYTAVGAEKLIYYEGRDNTIATRIATAGDDGFIFSVNGPINYLIVAPIGIDIEKYADDGP